MAILKQNENVQTVYLGWYGQCGEPQCEEFDLLSNSSIIAKVFQFSENGVGTRTYVSDVPDYMNSFTKLICGNPYYIILKKGSGEIEIPDFAHGFYSEETRNFGMITRTCTTSDVVQNQLSDEPKEDEDKEQMPCTKDVRVCPDGTTVGRDGFMECNFPPCGFDSEVYANMKKTWMSNQFNHYKFDFNWSCYCTEEMTQEVVIYVKYGKVYNIIKKDSLEEITLAQNEGIEESPDKQPVPMKYRSMEDLYKWVDSELKKHPFSVATEYDDETGFIKGLFIDKIQDMADEEIGFNAKNFEALELEGKCPSDYKRCKDGTLLKRDPNNDCKFPECPDVPDEVPEDETPLSDKEPKLEYRWTEQNGATILQVKNIINPWKTSNDDDHYLSWRTVYISREVNPIEVSDENWSHALVAYNYAEHHGEVEEYENLTIGIDDENNNQLIVMLGEDLVFLPDPQNIENAAHLYVYRRDTESLSHEVWHYPRIQKITDSGAVCTEDAKMCADGSYVGRNHYYNCTFFCPEDEIKMIDVNTPDNYQTTDFSPEDVVGDVVDDVINDDGIEAINDSDDNNTPTPMMWFPVNTWTDSDNPESVSTDDDTEVPSTDDGVDTDESIDAPVMIEDDENTNSDFIATDSVDGAVDFVDEGLDTNDQVEDLDAPMMVEDDENYDSDFIATDSVAGTVDFVDEGLDTNDQVEDLDAPMMVEDDENYDSDFVTTDSVDGAVDFVDEGLDTNDQVEDLDAPIMTDTEENTSSDSDYGDFTPVQEDPS